MIFVIMNIVWLLVWYMQTPTVIDVAWALTITACSMIFLYSSINEVNILYSVLIVVWGLRLSSYLFYTRVRKGIRDRRYLVLSHDWERPWLFYLISVHIQGVLIYILCLTVYALSTSSLNYFAWYDIIFAVMAILSVIYESIADEELYRFGREFPGVLCDIGLWRYSRHPNYFFEWCFWFTIAIVAFIKSGNPLSFCAPILLYIVMHYYTIPITEAGSVRSRGEIYIEYQKRTSKFFPWFRSKSVSK